MFNKELTELFKQLPEDIRFVCLLCSLVSCDEKIKELTTRVQLLEGMCARLSDFEKILNI